MRFTTLCLYTDGTDPRLSDALERAARLFTEVCIVDLDPEGAALPTAAAAGALTCRYRWSDNRAEALNAGLDLSSGDWTLLATAEELMQLEEERLAAFLDQHAAAIGTMTAGRVGPLELPAERALPAGERFAGRDQARLDSARPRIALPGWEPAAVSEPAPALPTQRFAACEAAYEQGLAHYREGRHEEALADLTRAVDVLEIEAPFSAHLLETVSWCLRALDRRDEALQLLDQVAGHFPERVDTQFLVALLCFETEAFERAEIGFQTCLTLAGTLPEGGPSEASRATYVALHNLGALRETLAMTDEAVEHYRRALAENPFYTPSREALERLGAEASTPS